MTLDGFRDVTETPISLDFSNSWIADIRLNAGDKDGRTITVAITDNGQPITSTTGIKSVALAYNTAPGVEVGDRVTMSPVSGEATATYRATLPRRAIAKPGVIALGVESGANALWSQTAQLPEVEIKSPGTILTKNTSSNMQAGLFYGFLGQTEYIIRQFKKELGREDIKVIATGGLGKIIYRHTDLIDVYDRDLTFKGLKIIYERCKETKR